MTLPTCDGFELSPVTAASERMPVVRGAGNGSGAVTCGAVAADVARDAEDVAGAFAYGVGAAALEGLRQLRAVTRGIGTDAVACGTGDGAGAVS